MNYRKRNTNQWNLDKRPYKCSPLVNKVLSENEGTRRTLPCGIFCITVFPNVETKRLCSGQWPLHVTFSTPPGLNFWLLGGAKKVLWCKSTHMWYWKISFFCDFALFIKGKFREVFYKNCKTVICDFHLPWGLTFSESCNFRMFTCSHS